MSERLRRLEASLPDAAPIGVTGRVVEVTGLAVRATLEGARVGDEVLVGDGGVAAQVVGFRDELATLLPLADLRGLRLGARVVATGRPREIRVGPAMIGRVLDGLGDPLDGRAAPAGAAWPVHRAAPPPLDRTPIARAFPTGVRAIDGLLTVGEGQRVGLFAGAGVGKSTLLAQLARHAAADVNVVALVGERGREVREFVEDCLGAEGLAKSVVVAATSDAPPLVRLEAAHVATSIAEWFAEVEGRRVLLLFDSVTRFARAQREAGLAAGEPPARQGYPPSVFAALPRLLERAGARRRGTITAFYTVLVAGGDLDEPVADEVRGILDGHVVLSRAIAERGRFPAVDPLASLSRLMPRLVAPAHAAAAARVRALVATHEAHRDVVALGAYARGADPAVDEALDRAPRVERFLQQPADVASPFEETIAALEEVAR
jgi:type III secretion protein N (ATPase)